MSVMMEIMPVLLEMEIKGTRRKSPYHITIFKLHVMLILLCTLLLCLDMIMMVA